MHPRLHATSPFLHSSLPPSLPLFLSAPLLLCSSQVRELLIEHTTREAAARKHWAVRAYLARECGPPAELRAALAGELEALRGRPEWKSDAKALDDLSEVAAQLVEARLDGGDDGEVREARKIVRELLHGATDTLGATQGAESLRMLQTRLDRHFDEDD